MLNQSQASKVSQVKSKAKSERVGSRVGSATLICHKIGNKWAVPLIIEFKRSELFQSLVGIHCHCNRRYLKRLLYLVFKELWRLPDLIIAFQMEVLTIGCFENWLKSSSSKALMSCDYLVLELGAANPCLTRDAAYNLVPDRNTPTGSRN